MDTVTLGMTKQTLISLIGTPLQETSQSGTIALWYHSKAPSLADIYTFSGDALSFVSLSFYEKPKTLDEYIRVYGAPKKSIIAQGKESPDSFHQVMHIWPEDGQAVSTIGSGSGSQVIREDIFAPTTLETYLTTWGAQYKGHETVILSVQTNTQNWQGNMSGGILVLLGLIVGVLLFIKARKRRKQLPERDGTKQSQQEL